MKFQMPRNSLFAILLRSRWWVSSLVALGVLAAGRLVLPEGFAPFAALPFIVIAASAAWKALSSPSEGRVAGRLERIRAMAREEFVAALEKGWREQGYEVSRCAEGAAADLELRREGRLTLVACRRWKAARTGVEPLRELGIAGDKREAQQLFYVIAGELSGQARAFAGDKRIRVVEGAELAALLR